MLQWQINYSGFLNTNYVLNVMFSSIGVTQFVCFGLQNLLETALSLFLLQCNQGQSSYAYDQDNFSDAYGEQKLRFIFIEFSYQYFINVICCYITLQLFIVLLLQLNNCYAYCIVSALQVRKLYYIDDLVAVSVVLQMTRVGCLRACYCQA